MPTVVQLRSQLQALGLPTTGKKSILEARLSKSNTSMVDLTNSNKKSRTRKTGPKSFHAAVAAGGDGSDVSPSPRKKRRTGRKSSNSSASSSSSSNKKTSAKKIATNKVATKKIATKKSLKRKTPQKKPDGQEFGCPKCRYSKNGCGKCNPNKKKSKISPSRANRNDTRNSSHKQNNKKAIGKKRARESTPQVTKAAKKPKLSANEIAMAKISANEKKKKSTAVVKKTRRR